MPNFPPSLRLTSILKASGRGQAPPGRRLASIWIRGLFGRSGREPGRFRLAQAVGQPLGREGLRRARLAATQPQPERGRGSARRAEEGRKAAATRAEREALEAVLVLLRGSSPLPATTDTATVSSPALLPAILAILTVEEARPRRVVLAMVMAALLPTLVAAAKLEEGSRQLRIGVLSTASISGLAIVDPVSSYCRNHVKLVAVAAREEARARSWVQRLKWPAGWPRPSVLPDYDALLRSAEVDAVYVPTPTGLHYSLVMRALESGKHVLVEKPFASNGEEARLMVELARRQGLILMEAMHWYYHPLRQVTRR